LIMSSPISSTKKETTPKGVVSCLMGNKDMGLDLFKLWSIGSDSCFNRGRPKR
jgi:hypothetical protein